MSVRGIISRICEFYRFIAWLGYLMGHHDWFDHEGTRKLGFVFGVDLVIYLLRGRFSMKKYAMNTLNWILPVLFFAYLWGHHDWFDREGVVLLGLMGFTEFAAEFIEEYA